MHLFFTDVLPFLAHDHPSAAAFLTCRHHNFHSSIIPEFLSDEERVGRFCEARQQNQLEVDRDKLHANMYNLFVQTPLMQFSPSLIVRQEDCAESILNPLLETKYFTRTLQRCCVTSDVPLSNDLLQGLSKVRSLAELDLGESEVKNQHLEIIVNSFPSLEILTIYYAGDLEIDNPKTAISISSPPPPVTKTLRSLAIREVDPLFAIQFIPYFTNLKKLDVSGDYSCPELDLLPLSSSLPLLTDLTLSLVTIENAESLKSLVHLSSLQFTMCHMPDLSFLSQENILRELTTLSLANCEELSTSSFASLSHAPNLRVLKLDYADCFNDDCLQYLVNMVHLRKLDLTGTNFKGKDGLFKTLMQSMCRQLEELNLSGCRVGGLGAIAGALYSKQSRLRVLNLSQCNLVDDDLDGIGALKNTLEVLNLSDNYKLTNEGFMNCKDLVKLKILKLERAGINDLSPVKDCLNLEKLDVSGCKELTDDSFQVFSEEPSSFPNLQILVMSSCEKLSEKVFEYLSKNNHLVYQLKELGVDGMFDILSSSETARNNLCQLKGLSRLRGVLSQTLWRGATSEEIEVARELMQRLKNLEEVR